MMKEYFIYMWICEKIIWPVINTLACERNYHIVLLLTFFYSLCTMVTGNLSATVLPVFYVCSTTRNFWYDIIYARLTYHRSALFFSHFLWVRVQFRIFGHEKIQIWTIECHDPLQCERVSGIKEDVGRNCCFFYSTWNIFFTILFLRNKEMLALNDKTEGFHIIKFLIYYCFIFILFS